MIWLATLLLAVIPHQGVIVDEADLAELNHFYDGQARHVFDQLIFWDFDERSGTHQVVAWRMSKSVGHHPRYDERDGIWKTIFFDSQKGNCFRRVNTKYFRETITQYDPELEERKKLPMERRRELSKPPERIMGHLKQLEASSP